MKKKTPGRPTTSVIVWPNVIRLSLDWNKKGLASGVLIMWGESVVNFGWFFRPEMSCLGFFFGGIVDMRYSESKLNILLWACRAMKKIELSWTCFVYQKEAIAHFFRLFRVHFLICPFSQERLDESYWNLSTSFT